MPDKAGGNPLLNDKQNCRHFREEMPRKKLLKATRVIAVVAIIAIAIFLAWWFLIRQPPIPHNIIQLSGRIEGDEIERDNRPVRHGWCRGSRTRRGSARAPDRWIKANGGGDTGPVPEEPGIKPNSAQPFSRLRLRSSQ